jgi:hypothetical protein
MRLSTCSDCGQLVYFENTSCTRCGSLLGFNAEKLKIESFTSIEKDLLQPVDRKESNRYRYCSNGLTYNACNWVVNANDDNELCIGCRLNRTIPDINMGNNLYLWVKIETEKRRLLYSLLALSLPLAPTEPDAPQLAFDFLAETVPVLGKAEPVITGHADGLITLNINEADSSIREKMREAMSEPYRTLLGHFRHESGHYYWDVLVRNSEWLESVRELFGDDTLDYGKALTAYYEQGPVADWQLQYVSAYASSHPWEDWAETWAHYLHIIDTIETAHEFGLKVHPSASDNERLQTDIETNPYRTKDFRKIIQHWLPLTYALNSLNRSIGHEHAYPFVLDEPVIKKLDLVHRILQNNIQQSKLLK